MKHKKGQASSLNQLVPVVLILVTVGLVIGAGVLILEKFADKVQTTSATSYENDQFTLSHYLNITANTTTKISAGTFTTISAVTVYNATYDTDNAIYHRIESPNYTINYDTGEFNLTTGASYITFVAQLNYTVTYNNNPPSYQATTNSTKGIGEIASFLPTIGIIIAAVIIIALIVGAFAGAANRRR